MDDGMRVDNEIGGGRGMVMHHWIPGRGPACGAPVNPDRSLGSTPNRAQATCPDCVPPDLTDPVAIEEWLAT